MKKRSEKRHRGQKAYSPQPSYTKTKAGAPWIELGLKGAPLQALKRSSFTEPTEIQIQAIPHALRGQDILGIAPTGTGKTLAYLLPMWQRIQQNSTRALVIVPTRELAYQVSQMLQKLHQPLRDKTIVLVGGRSSEADRASLLSSWNIGIVTPGRMLDLLGPLPKCLQSVSLVVYDEFDKLLKMGFHEQLEGIQQHLPKPIQTFCYSATAPSEQEKPPLHSNAHVIVVENKQKEKIEEYFYFLKTPKKKGSLCIELLEKHKGQTIVFVRNREKANHVNGLLKLNNIPCELFHGKIGDTQRIKTFQKFLDGKISTLIATDLAGRGLDTLHVDFILNYDLPQNIEDYLHRCGRAGRLGQKGFCYSFAEPSEYIAFKSIEQGLPYPIPCHPNYGRIDKWILSARAKHQKEVEKQKRLTELREAQGVKCPD